MAISYDIAFSLAYESKMKISIYANMVNEGKQLDAVRLWLHYLRSAKILDFIDAIAEGYPGLIDAVAFRKQCEVMLYRIGECYNGRVGTPEVAKSSMEHIKAKLDLIAGEVVRIGMAVDGKGHIVALKPSQTG